jgi:hypothetical protein
MFCWWFMAVVPTVEAWESDSAHGWPSDEVDLFEVVDYDTGWQPANGGIQFKFAISATGGAEVDMEGDASLSWPEALTHGWVPEPGSGDLLLDTRITIGVYVRFTLAPEFGGQQWEGPLRESTLDFFEMARFDPFLLGEEWAQVASPAASMEVFAFEENVVPLVSVRVETDATPAASVAYRTAYITTTGAEAVGDTGDTSVETCTLDQEGDTGVFSIPAGDSLELQSIFTGQWQSTLSVDFVTSVSVCVEVLGCQELGALSTPVFLHTSQFEQDFPPVSLSHPLPDLQVEQETLDFGAVAVGEVVSQPLTLKNRGTLDLVGAASLYGQGDFDVFPRVVSAAPGLEDGVTLSFAPESAGNQEVTLYLSTNDPDTPDLPVRLVGEGIGTAEEPAGEKLDAGRCGCSAPLPWPVAWTWLLPLLGLRRRCAG